MATWLEKNDDICNEWAVREKPADWDKWEALRQMARERKWKLAEGIPISGWWEKRQEMKEIGESWVVFAVLAKAIDDSTPLPPHGYDPEEDRPYAYDNWAEAEEARMDRVHEELGKAWDELVERAYQIKQQATPPPAATPPPDEAAAKGDKLNRKQLIFLQMLIKQWKHHYEQNDPMTDMAAAESVEGTPVYRNDRSQATAFNKWKQHLPNELRPPTSNRGGKRSPK